MQMKTFDTYFSLKLVYSIFSAMEHVCINIQSKDTTVEEGTRGAEVLRAHYTSLWSETAFITFYWSTVESTSGLMDESALPRYCKAPTFDEGAQPHQYIHLLKRVNIESTSKLLIMLVGN